ncbi:hypothetical protein [Niabella aquatica]
MTSVLFSRLSFVMIRNILFLTIPLLLSVTEATAQTIRYVSMGGAGIKDGLSRPTASGDILLMINQSAPDDQIGIASARSPKQSYCSEREL